MKAQLSVVSEKDMSWSVVSTGPYMDMLYVRVLPCSFFVFYRKC